MGIPKNLETMVVMTPLPKFKLPVFAANGVSLLMVSHMVFWQAYVMPNSGSAHNALTRPLSFFPMPVSGSHAIVDS